MSSVDTVVYKQMNIIILTKLALKFFGIQGIARADIVGCVAKATMHKTRKNKKMLK